MRRNLRGLAWLAVVLLVLVVEVTATPDVLVATDRTTTDETKPHQKPGRVRNLRVTLTDDNSFDVTWAAGSNGGAPIRRYHVELRWSGTSKPFQFDSSARKASFVAAYNVTYTVSVRAENRIGRGSTATIAITTRPASSAPGAVRNLRVTLTDYNDFEVTWDAPSDDGGAPIQRYQVEIVWPGGRSDPLNYGSSDRRATFFSLYENTQYTVNVWAQNSNGSGQAVSRSVRTGQRPSGSAPGAVRNLRVTLVDDDSFMVTWDPPSDDGGVAIKRYLVTVSRPGWRQVYTDWTSGHTFNGSGGITYTVSVKAENSIGSGPSVTRTVTTQGTSPPGTVRNLQASLTDHNSFEVTWDHPADDGGAPIQRYRIEIRSGGASDFYNYGPSTRRARFDEEEETQYYISVWAENQNGQGDRVSWLITTGAASKPGVVRNLNVALTDDDSFEVTWDPPADDGGASVTRYLATVTRSGWKGMYTSWKSGHTFNGRKGAKYTVSIRAQNRNGSGPAVTRTVTIPGGGATSKPGAVRNLRVALTDDDGFRVTWDPPSDDGGASVTRYLATVSRSGWEGMYTSWRSGHTFNGRKGAKYTVSIRAQNRNGSGPAVTRTVTIPGGGATSKPGAVRNLRVALTDDDGFRVTWDPPSDDGGASVTRYLATVSRSGWEGMYTSWRSGHTFNGRKGAKYTVSIRAQNRNGSGPAVTRTVTIPGGGATSKPGAVRNVTAGAHKEKQLKVTWSGPASNGGSPIDHYLVQYHVGSWSSKIYRIDDSTVDYSPKLSANKTYRVTVIAINEAGKRSPTATTTGRTASEALGRVTITDMEWLESWRGWDRDDAVLVEWEKISSATGYELAYWYRVPYGEKMNVNSMETYVTVSEMLKRGRLVCEEKASRDTRLPCEPKDILEVSGGSITQYETPQLPDEKIPVRLEVAVRAVNSGGSGPWSEPYSFPQKNCSRQLDLGNLGRAAIALRLIQRVPSQLTSAISAVASIGNIVDEVVNNCRGIGDAIIKEVLDKIPYLKDFLKAYEKAKCIAKNLDVSTNRLATDNHPTAEPYIWCGVVYDIDQKRRHDDDKKYPFE